MNQKEKQLLEGTGVKILIVDDISKNLYLLEVLFKSAGYETITAKNGIEALEKLRANQIDGIVSDILMPLMDGFRLIRECKKDPVLRQIPFIFYTATYTEKKDEEFGLSLGAIRYIIKPAEPEELLRQINEAFQEHTQSPRNYTMQPVLDEVTFSREYAQRVGAKLEKKARLLEESEEKYRLIYDNSMDAILIASADGGIIGSKSCCLYYVPADGRGNNQNHQGRDYRYNRLPFPGRTGRARPHRQIQGGTHLSTKGQNTVSRGDILHSFYR